MKKIILYILSFSVLQLLYTQNLKAQQSALFNTYKYDLIQLNIASIGRTCKEINLNYRTQWSGIDNNSTLYQMNAGMSLDKANSIGIKVSQQNLGLLQLNNFTVGYSYKIKVNLTTKLHLGMGMGWQQNKFRTKNAYVMDANDPSLGNRILGVRSNNLDMEASALCLSTYLTAGFGVNHLYNTNSEFKGTSGSIKIKPELNMLLAYKFNKNRPIEIEPWVVSRYTINGTFQSEFMVNTRFNQMFVLGAGYRRYYGYLLLFGFELKQYTICYSFDFTDEKDKKSFGTSHQILLKIDLCKKKERYRDLGTFL
jgi:type IX secretion system PorP/SprF family membrane protein